MSASNVPSRSPGTSKRRPVMIIAMFPIGAILGFLGGLLIEIIVGLIARAVFSAEHPAAFSMRFLGAIPGLGSLIGVILAPILYGRVTSSESTSSRRTGVRTERQSRL